MIIKVPAGTTSVAIRCTGDTTVIEIDPIANDKFWTSAAEPLTWKLPAYDRRRRGKILRHVFPIAGVTVAFVIGFGFADRPEIEARSSASPVGTASYADAMPLPPPEPFPHPKPSPSPNASFGLN